MLVPDLAYPRAFTLRVGRTDQSYVDLDDPLRLEFDYVQRLVDVLDSVAGPGQRLRVVHVGGAAMTVPLTSGDSAGVAKADAAPPTTSAAAMSAIDGSPPTS